MSTYFDRAYVESVIREEAERAGVSFEDVAHLCRRVNATEARRKAVCRIMAEKDCTATTLATVWGCDPKHVVALQAAEPRVAPVKLPGRPKPPPRSHQAALPDRRAVALGPRRGPGGADHRGQRSGDTAGHRGLAIARRGEG